MIKICVVGTNQSGSTRLFNLVRLIYEKKGKTVYSGVLLKKKDINNNYDVFLSKVHDIPLEYMNDYNIKLLPIRNILDASISSVIRFFPDNKENPTVYINSCIYNIYLLNKFKSYVDFIFRYENYSVYYIKKLCDVLNVNLNNNEILEIMKELDNMHNSKDIVKNDDLSNEIYKKTLLSQNHNTSNGKTNKYIKLNPKILNEILKNNEILNFLEEHQYF
jgi:hypothetical protein